MKTQSWLSPLWDSKDYLKAEQYAKSDWPILIHGESGVGKEYLARWLHKNSFSSDGPFIAVNCAALPSHLIESELFGHEKGAFTGANQQNPGLIRSAIGGTLFLDEIGELDICCQAKFLRFLDSGEIRPVGGRRFLQVPVRVFAATHVDLNAAVRNQKFRLDLYERLSVLDLRLPPLRLKPEAIVPIAQNLLRHLEAKWDPEALRLLTPFPWPGNIRQLRNFLARAVLMGAGYVSIEVLTEALQEQVAYSEKTPKGLDLENLQLWEIEKNVVRARILKFKGNKKAAAEDLGIGKSTLHEMLRRWRKQELVRTAYLS